MKNKIKWFGIIAFIAVIGFSMAALSLTGCGGGDSGVPLVLPIGPQTAIYTGTSGGTTYTLKITENTARYAAQSGDAYELTAGSKRSAGKVNSVSGGVLTLKPSDVATTFTVTVLGISITALNGTITWTDNTTASAPGTLTGGTTPGGNASGGFTLTGIPAQYNGKYARFTGSGGEVMLTGYQNMTSNDIILPQIANGKVTIPLWEVRDVNNPSSWVRYTGNGTFMAGVVNFYNSGSDNVNKNGPEILNIMFMFITFSNGSATKSWSDSLTGPLLPQN